jgi:transposase
MSGMSNDEFEKRFNNAMATIIENQARFDEAQARINESLAQVTGRQNRFDEQMRGIQEAIAGLIQVARLNTEQIEKLVEDQRTTRENLNALIRVVEEHISNHP